MGGAADPVALGPPVGARPYPLAEARAEGTARDQSQAVGPEARGREVGSQRAEVCLLALPFPFVFGFRKKISGIFGGEVGGPLLLASSDGDGDGVGG